MAASDPIAGPSRRPLPRPLPIDRGPTFRSLTPAPAGPSARSSPAYLPPRYRSASVVSVRGREEREREQEEQRHRRARAQSLARLKTSWDVLYDKYAAIGLDEDDEVDLSTGVVKDRGRIARMERREFAAYEAGDESGTEAGSGDDSAPGSQEGEGEEDDGSGVEGSGDEDEDEDELAEEWFEEVEPPVEREMPAMTQEDHDDLAAFLRAEAERREGDEEGETEAEAEPNDESDGQSAYSDPEAGPLRRRAATVEYRYHGTRVYDDSEDLFENGESGDSDSDELLSADEEASRKTPAPSTRPSSPRSDPRPPPSRPDRRERTVASPHLAERIQRAVTESATLRAQATQRSASVPTLRDLFTPPLEDYSMIDPVLRPPAAASWASFALPSVAGPSSTGGRQRKQSTGDAREARGNLVSEPWADVQADAATTATASGSAQAATGHGAATVRTISEAPSVHALPLTVPAHLPPVTAAVSTTSDVRGEEAPTPVIQQKRPVGRPRKSAPDPVKEKRPVGRPRKTDPALPKRPVGRPRKSAPDTRPAVAPSAAPVSPTPASRGVEVDVLFAGSPVRTGPTTTLNDVQLGVGASEMDARARENDGSVHARDAPAGLLAADSPTSSISASPVDMSHATRASPVTPTPVRRRRGRPRAGTIVIRVELIPIPEPEVVPPPTDAERYFPNLHRLTQHTVRFCRLCRASKDEARATKSYYCKGRQNANWCMLAKELGEEVTPVRDRNAAIKAKKMAATEALQTPAPEGRLDASTAEKVVTKSGKKERRKSGSVRPRQSLDGADVVVDAVAQIAPSAAAAPSLSDLFADEVRLRPTTTVSAPVAGGLVEARTPPRNQPASVSPFAAPPSSKGKRKRIVTPQSASPPLEGVAQDSSPMLGADFSMPPSSPPEPPSSSLYELEEAGSHLPTPSPTVSIEAIRPGAASSAASTRKTPVNVTPSATSHPTPPPSARSSSTSVRTQHFSRTLPRGILRMPSSSSLRSSSVMQDASGSELDTDTPDRVKRTRFSLQPRSPTHDHVSMDYIAHPSDWYDESEASPFSWRGGGPASSSSAAPSSSPAFSREMTVRAADAGVRLHGYSGRLPSGLLKALVPSYFPIGRSQASLSSTDMGGTTTSSAGSDQTGRRATLGSSVRQGMSLGQASATLSAAVVAAATAPARGGSVTNGRVGSSPAAGLMLPPPVPLRSTPGPGPTRGGLSPAPAYNSSPLTRTMSVPARLNRQTRLDPVVRSALSVEKRLLATRSDKARSKRRARTSVSDAFADSDSGPDSVSGSEGEADFDFDAPIVFRTALPTTVREKSARSGSRSRSMSTSTYASVPASLRSRGGGRGGGKHGAGIERDNARSVSIPRAPSASLSLSTSISMPALSSTRRVERARERDRDTPRQEKEREGERDRDRSRTERELQRVAREVGDDAGLEWGMDEDVGKEVAREWREGSVVRRLVQL